MAKYPFSPLRQLRCTCCQQARCCVHLPMVKDLSSLSLFLCIIIWDTSYCLTSVHSKQRYGRLLWKMAKDIWHSFLQPQILGCEITIIISRTQRQAIIWGKSPICTATVKSTLFCHGSSWSGSDIKSHGFNKRFFGGSLINLSGEDNVRAGGNLSLWKHAKSIKEIWSIKPTKHFPNVTHFETLG